jgi:uncharacterized caspase-like protein
MEASTPGPSRRVLLVGINDYTSAVRQRPAEASTYPVPGDLAGPRNDVGAFADVLEARFGFRPSDMRRLLDGEATRQGILDAIEEHLVAPCQAGDEVVFYFSGHGTWVRNSKSQENRQIDEALVPADFAAGAPGIRDKELRRLFRPLLERGGRLTLVIDSCHAGGMTRGGTPRFTASTSFDVQDGEDAGEPLDKVGALALLAAKDHQFAYEAGDDGGKVHGRFTRALLLALGQGRAGESARDVFLRTRAILCTTAIPQEPELAAQRERREEPLFGAGRGAASATQVAIRRVDWDGNVVLQGGWATGLAVGTELEVPADGDRPAYRLRIESVTGPCQANARLVDTDRLQGGSEEAPALPPGTLAEVTVWSFSQEPSLKVWWSEATLTAESLIQEVDRLRVAWGAAGGVWSLDPVGQKPDLYLYWDQGQWVCLRSGGTVEIVGNRLDAAALRALLEGAPGAPVLFLDTPVPRGGLAGIALGAGTTNSSLERTIQPEEAHYQLQGRGVGRGLEFRWVRSDALVGRSGFPQSMPQGSGWIPFHSRAGEDSSLASILTNQALRLARVQAILTLPEPPYGGFPYRLVVRDATRDRQLRRRADEGALERVEEHALLGLMLEPVDPANTVSKLRSGVHYVYVFAINSAGRSVLLFPNPEAGVQPNAVGADLEHAWQGEAIVLGQDLAFKITGPFGLDTYFLLATREALPDPLVLEFDGVRDAPRQDRSGLGALLSRWAAPQRGTERLPTLATWSLERLELLSEPAEKEP